MQNAIWELNETDIHLYLIAIDTFIPQFLKFYDLLNEREKNRTNRFLFDKDKHQYAISEGFLRIILGKYTAVTPKEIIFERASRGKPFLESSQNSLDIRFNMTHSKNFAVISVTRNKEIGVDIESSDRTIDISSLAESIFSKAEIVWLNQAHPQELKHCFLYLWTRKESILKQTGEGLYSNKLTEYTTTPFDLPNLIQESFGYVHAANQKSFIQAFHPNIAAQDFKTQQETYYVTVCYEGPQKSVKVFAFNEVQEPIPVEMVYC